MMWLSTERRLEIISSCHTPPPVLSFNTQIKQTTQALLKYGMGLKVKDWNTDKFITQVRDAIDIVKVKYPEQFHVMYRFFDQSSGYTAFVYGALK